MVFPPLPDPTQNRKKKTHTDMIKMANAVKHGEGGQSQQPFSSKPQARPRPIPSAEVKGDPSATNLSMPQPALDSKEGGYREYTIFSSAPTHRKFSILTFKPRNSNTIVEFPGQFQRPLKLNRKQPKSMLYAPPPNHTNTFLPAKQLLGPDREAVYSTNQEIVMLNAEEMTAASFVKMSAKWANPDAD